MEFKGTKGEWKIELTNDYYEDCIINHIPNIGILFDENSDIESEEIDANLLLISKAPELLEMLKRLIQPDLDISDLIEAENLIKEATEI